MAAWIGPAVPTEADLPEASTTPADPDRTKERT